MASITRTLKVHTYTFGTINPDTLQINNVTRLESPVKLGTRKLAEEAKSRSASLLNTSVTEVLWAMDLEDFYKWGHAKGADDEDESEPVTASESTEDD